MSWMNFAIIVGLCAATMLISRIVPLFLLKGRELPPKLEQALNYIPPAAFAALVVNDLFTLELLHAATWREYIGLIASIPVIIVALKTRSLTWCIVTGVGCFGILLLIYEFVA